MNHTGRFDGKGDLYAKARPKYADALFDHIKNTLHIPAGSVFADIGSGTGIFTEQLLACGYRVYAVEPNADMRQKAEERLSDNAAFTSVNGTERETHLPHNSVDFVTAAQAFHWFDAAAFRTECQRILKPGGKIMLVYNSRDEEAECVKALAELRRKYAPDFPGFSNGISDQACRAFFDGGCEVFRADNSQIYNRRGYIDRVLSSSYSLREGAPGYTVYLEDINRLFDRFSVNGFITVPTDTVAYIG